MKKITELLETRIAKAIKEVSGVDAPALVRPAADAKFGDYQANGIMAAAKQVKTNPRQLAEKVVAALDVSDLSEPPEVAGPGFINLRLTDGFLAERLLGMHRDAERLGIDRTEMPQTVVVDYSGPNIAKQMHVGHLRSTIIGDCIARLYEFTGHTVIRQNHIGDWGLQIGMIINALIKQEFGEECVNFKNQETAIKTYKELERSSDNYPEFQQSFRQKFRDALQVHLESLEEAYKKEVECIKTDQGAERDARQRTYDLQNGDAIAIVFWEEARKMTLEACFSVYDELKITLENEDVRGESFYANKLAGVIDDLKSKGLAVESEGAMCVFPEGFTKKDGQPLPFIIQKSDGAFLYATTDLAALRFRLDELKAEKVIYVTDARQALHFQMLFSTAKMAGWVRDGVTLEHVTFGTMLGADGKPFKTRAGGTVKLKDLLDEAIERAKGVVEAKNPDLPAEQKQRIAQAVGVGAVKYADYANNRNSDFVFSYDRMLAMDGNTAPYMQYAYARIKSIERKAAGKDVDIRQELDSIAALPLAEPAEKDLAKLLVRYDQAIAAAMAECRPNYLTGYLYDLAQAFSRFYTACPVLTAEPQHRPTRLLLCDLTARTIRHGLSELLGIEVVEQM